MLAAFARLHGRSTATQEDDWVCVTLKRSSRAVFDLPRRPTLDDRACDSLPCRADSRCPSAPHAERMGYPPDEFARAARSWQRRVAAGHSRHVRRHRGTRPALRFRQDNDFYYLTGNESLNARARHRRRHQGVAALPAQADAVAGPLRRRQLARRSPTRAKAHGFTSIQPITALGEFLGRRRAVSPARRRCGRGCRSATRSTSGRIDAAIEAGTPAGQSVRAAPHRGRRAHRDAAAAVPLPTSSAT